MAETSFAVHMDICVALYLQANHSDCMGCSSASAGSGSKVEMVAEHRKRVWDEEFSAVRSQMNVVVCLHLQEEAVYI